VGQAVHYTDVAGLSHPASVLSVHADEAGGESYYTVLVEGEERTTVASRLQQMQQSVMYNEVLSEAELSDLDLTLQASAFVLRGAWVAKFFTGKVGRHRRFAKVTGSSGTLTWGKHVGVMARADPSPYPDDGVADGAARLQREQRVT